MVAGFGMGTNSKLEPPSLMKLPAYKVPPVLLSHRLNFPSPSCHDSKKRRGGISKNGSWRSGLRRMLRPPAHFRLLRSEGRFVRIVARAGITDTDGKRAS
jgi:hypothetical protein